MKKYTVHIQAPPETVFAAVLDPELQSGRGLRWEAVKETPDGVGSTYRWYYEVLGMRLGGGSFTYSEYVPDRRVKFEFSHGGPSMVLAGGPVSSLWTFEPADGGTDLTVAPEFRTLIPVVNHLARRIMMRSWQKKDLPKLKAQTEKRAAANVKT